MIPGGAFLAESRVSLAMRLVSVLVHPRQSVATFRVAGELPNREGVATYGDGRQGAQSQAGELVHVPMDYAKAQELTQQIEQLYDVVMVRRRMT